MNELLDQSDESLGRYLKGLNNSKASMGGYSNSLKTAKASTVGLTIATTLLNTAISFGIMAGISLLIKGISNYINKIDNLKSKVEESSQAYKETQSELDDVNKKLDENNKLIAEINKNPLNYTGDKTLDDLKQQNLELEKQKKILEQVSEMKSKKVKSDSEKYLYANGAFSSGSIMSETPKYITKANQLIDERNNIISKGAISKDDLKRLADINSQYDDIKTKLANNIEEIQKNKENLDPNSETFKAIVDIENEFLKLSDKIKGEDISDGITEEYLKARDAIDNSKSYKYTFNPYNITKDSKNLDEYKSMFDSTENTSSGGAFFSISGNTLEQYDKITKIIDYINEKKLKGIKLNRDEENLLNELEKKQSTLAKTNDKYYPDYIGGKVSEANSKLQNYLKTYNVNADNFKESKEAILNLAGSDETLKSILNDLINQTFPDEVYQVQLMTDADKAYYYQQKMNIEQTKEQADAEYDLLKTKDEITKKQSLLTTATKEMNDNGSISSATYLDLISLGDEYKNCIELQNGKLVFNAKAFQQIAYAEEQKHLADLKLKETDLTEKIESERESLKNLTIDFNNATTAEIAYYFSKKGALQDALHGDTEALNNIKTEMAVINDLMNPTPEKEKNTKTEDTWKESFEKQLAQQKHFLAMGKNEITNKAYTEKDYLDWLEKAYKEYFSNLTKYQDEYNQYEEEVYNGRKELREKEIEEQKKAIDNEISYLEEQKKTYEDLFNQKLEDSIKPIDEKIEALKKQNEELDKTNQLLDAQNDLENAKNKSVFTFNGSSWGYQQDTEAIKEAEDKLTKVETDIEIDNLEKKKKELEDNSTKAIDALNQFFDGLISVLSGESPLQSNPEVYKNLQYTPATLDKIGKFNISDEAKKLFGLNIATNLNGNLVNLTDFSKIGKQLNNTLLPTTNNESQKTLMIDKICDQIVLNDVKNADDFVAQLVNQLPTAISNYLKK